ncbi:unnamed protein product [Urochloa humidicola]
MADPSRRDAAAHDGAADEEPEWWRMKEAAAEPSSSAATTSFWCYRRRQAPTMGMVSGVPHPAPPGGSSAAPCPDLRLGRAWARRPVMPRPCAAAGFSGERRLVSPLCGCARWWRPGDAAVAASRPCCGRVRQGQVGGAAAVCGGGGRRGCSYCGRARHGLFFMSTMAACCCPWFCQGGSGRVRGSMVVRRYAAVAALPVKASRWSWGRRCCRRCRLFVSCRQSVGSRRKPWLTLFVGGDGDDIHGCRSPRWGRHRGVFCLLYMLSLGENPVHS